MPVIRRPKGYKPKLLPATPLRRRWVDQQIDQAWHVRIRRMLSERGIDVTDLPTDTQELAIKFKVPPDRVHARTITHREIELWALAWADAQPKAEYMPATWFGDSFGIPASRLRKAAERGALPKRGSGRRIQYSVAHARELWPHDVHTDA